MQLKNISKHRPSDLIIDVPEEDVKAILKTNEFVELTKENLIVKKKVEKVEEVIEKEEEIEDIDKSKLYNL